jgi:hypothetical protein
MTPARPPAEQTAAALEDLLRSLYHPPATDQHGGDASYER